MYKSIDKVCLSLSLSAWSAWRPLSPAQNTLTCGCSILEGEYKCKTPHFQWWVYENVIPAFLRWVPVSSTHLDVLFESCCYTVVVWLKFEPHFQCVCLQHWCTSQLKQLRTQTITVECVGGKWSQKQISQNRRLDVICVMNGTVACVNILILLLMSMPILVPCHSRNCTHVNNECYWVQILSP